MISGKKKYFFLSTRGLVQFFQVVRLVGKLPHGIDVGDKDARLSLALCADHPQDFGAFYCYFNIFFWTASARLWVCSSRPATGSSKM